MPRTLIELVRAHVALACASAMFLFILRVEWFDILRHGPPSQQLAMAYSAYAVTAGFIGWSVAALFTSRWLWRRSVSP